MREIEKKKPHGDIEKRNGRVCYLSMEEKPNICVDRSVLNYWEDWKEKELELFAYHALMINFGKLALM